MGVGIYIILVYKIFNAIIMIIIKMGNEQMVYMAIARKMAVNKCLQPLGSVITTPHATIHNYVNPIIGETLSDELTASYRMYCSSHH